MAANIHAIRRPSDKALWITAAAAFPLIVLAGYFRSYYFRPFFENPPFANSLVHFHAVTMSVWVLYFTAQVALARTKNLKLHISMGMAGVALAVLVVVVGMTTAWDSHIVRGTAPAGIDPHAFFLVPALDMIFFILFFGGAIYWRKKPAYHKTLMLMTAINFSPAAIARMPLLPADLMMVQWIVFPIVLGIACFAYYTWKHRSFNWVFFTALLLFSVSGPARLVLAFTQPWLDFVGWMAQLAK